MLLLPFFHSPSFRAFNPTRAGFSLTFLKSGMNAVNQLPQQTAT